MSARQPMTRQRSPWLVNESGPPLFWTTRYDRRVHDGELLALVANEETIGWHLSISHRGHSGALVRYPTWDEIAHARYELLPADLDFVMHLPPMDEFVALHETTFHLHQHPEPGSS